MAVITRTVELRLNKCERCSHEWEQRRKRRPKVCPECKSREWNVPRVIVAPKLAEVEELR